MKYNSKSIIEIKELGTLKLCKYIRNDFDENEWNEFIKYERAIYKSINNKETDTTDEMYRKYLKDTKGEYDNHRWLLLNETGNIIGRGFLWHFNQTSDMYESNQEIADIYIDIDEQYRRKGYGEIILNQLFNHAKKHNKTKLQSGFSVEAAKHFAIKFGFKMESERFLSELKVKDIDVNKLEEWSNREREVMIVKDIPNDILNEYCQLYTACGLMAPDYEGDYTATEQMTPKSLRAREKLYNEKGIQLYTAISVEDDGTLSGMTELDYGEGYFKQVDQGLTGVLPRYRGQGIGKQLKAALLLHIIKVNPKAETIHTANNNKNHAMLAINKAMGFKMTKPHYLVTKKL